MANVEANNIKFTHKLTKQLKKKIEIFREIKAEVKSKPPSNTTVAIHLIVNIF